MKVLITGDFAPRRRVAEQIALGNFSCLDEMRPIISEADYAIVNFECPVVKREAEHIEKTGPNLKCNEMAMECIAHAGFHCVTLANNHFRDYGQIGVEDTLETCLDNHIDYVGGGINIMESRKILYKTIEDKVLAIINACENEWSIASEEHGGSNPLNIVQISRDIMAARLKADYVLVIIHGGTEMYRLPTPRMKEIYRFFIELGADSVVNHHQHCYSGYELYQGKPIFYGLGNFCFDKTKAGSNEMWENGFALMLDLNGTVQFNIYPYIQCSDDNPTVCLKCDKEGFERQIHHLNQIIDDDKSLNYYFAEWACHNSSQVDSLLIPYDGKLLKSLNSRHLFPSLINYKRVKMLLALVRCEAHRDIMIESLNRKIDHK